MDHLDGLLDQPMSTLLRGPAQTEEIHLSIGGVPLTLRCQGPTIAARLRSHYRLYLEGTSKTPQGNAPRATLELHEFGPESPEPYSLLWEDEDPEFSTQESRVYQRDFAAERVSPTLARAILAPGIDDSFHNLLRWFLPPLLLQGNTFLVHGAGVISEGRAFAFFGPSGAGKSTISSLISSADETVTVLGDDAILLTLKGNTPWLVAAPLGSGYSRDAPPPLSAPLLGIYSLEQSTENQILPIPIVAGAARLIASAMNLRFDRDTEARLDLAARFASSSIAIQTLRFQKSPSIWSFLRTQVRFLNERDPQKSNAANAASISNRP